MGNVLGMGANLEAKPMGPILPLSFLPTCLGFPCATFSEEKQPGTSNRALTEPSGRGANLSFVKLSIAIVPEA